MTPSGPSSPGRVENHGRIVTDRPLRAGQREIPRLDWTASFPASVSGSVRSTVMIRKWSVFLVAASVAASISWGQERVPMTPAPPPGTIPPLFGPGRTPDGTGIPGAPGSVKAEVVKELIPALIDALKDSEGDVRSNAAAALAGLGRQAVEPMHEQLKDKNQDRELRANIIQVLAQLGRNASDTLPTLLGCLKDKGEDKEVRR